MSYPVNNRHTYREKHNMKLKNSIIVALLVLCISLSGCSGIKTVDYQTADYGMSKTQLIEKIGSDPNEETTDENGTEQFIYKKSKYLDFTGQMTYYSMNDSILFTRWESTVEDAKEAKKMYDAIVESIKDSYTNAGEETPEGSNYSYVWSENGRTTTVAYLQETEHIRVSITDINQNTKSGTLEKNQKTE